MKVLLLTAKMIMEHEGECTLFPSKEQRDWSKFTAPWYNKLIEPKFHVGQYITDGYVGGQITSIDNYTCYKILDFMGGINTTIPFTLQDNYHLWTIQDAKDGDVLAAHECYVVFKEIDGLNIKCYCTYHYLGFNPSFYIDALQNKDAFLPSTKEQRDALMKAMNNTGYEWDIEKKELKRKCKR